MKFLKTGRQEERQRIKNKYLLTIKGIPELLDKSSGIFLTYFYNRDTI